MRLKLPKLPQNSSLHEKGLLRRVESKRGFLHDGMGPPIEPEKTGPDPSILVQVDCAVISAAKLIGGVPILCGKFNWRKQSRPQTPYMAMRGRNSAKKQCHPRRPLRIWRGLAASCHLRSW